jgi:DNA-binding transcriptional LysR family regulator
MNPVPFAQLLAFLAVARHRSFSGAARELGVSRSAVSQSVRQPEELLRVVLLARTTRFRARHPRVEVEIVIEERLVDLVAEGYDAGVRLSESIEGDARPGGVVTSDAHLNALLAEQGVGLTAPEA